MHCSSLFWLLNAIKRSDVIWSVFLYMWLTFSVWTLIWFSFRSCRVVVLCASCYQHGVSFLWRRGTFFFSLVKDLSMPLTMPSSIPIIWRFDLFVVPHISCLFHSYFSLFFCILCLFYLYYLLYCQAMIYHHLVGLFILLERLSLEFSSWVTGTFDYIFISVWGLLNFYVSLLNFVFNSWTFFVI